MLMFVDGLLSFISLPSFMFVSAAVSDIRELNLNKEEEVENGNLTPFPGLQFSPELPFDLFYALNLLEV